jgi:hypothetical protein
MTVKTYAQIIIGSCDRRDQFLADIFEAESPLSLNPIEFAIHPYTESEFMPIGVIFLSHTGIINIP